MSSPPGHSSRVCLLSDLTPESLQYMHSTPFFNLQQQKRFDYLRDIGEKIESISKHFENYSKYGEKMTQELLSLQESLGQIEHVCTDPYTQELFQQFIKAGSSFQTHFQIVDKTIVSPLNSFVSDQIHGLILIEKENERDYNELSSSEDKYVSVMPSSKPSLRQEREDALIQAHTTSTLSFFDFSSKMEDLEAQLQTLFPNLFASYLNSIATPFANYTSPPSPPPAHQSSQNKIVISKDVLRSQIPIYWQRLAARYTPTSDSSIQGYLWKRCGRFAPSWKRRFFMCSNGVISYSDTVNGALRSAKNISLLLCSIREEPSLRSNCFSITTRERVYVLQALTQWDLHHWLSVIQNNIVSQLNSSDDGPKAPSTEVCCDCGAVGATWCSMNFCVKLCDLCSAVHRSIPSKIRSLTLDDIDPLQLEMMEAVGSDFANSILEFKVAGEKINDGADNTQRRAFIQKKYCGLLYADDASGIDLRAAISEGSVKNVYKCIAAGKLKKLSGYGPIHTAAIIGNPLIMHLICLNVPSVDIEDEGGWTPLSYAVFYGNEGIVEILISYGAVAKSKDLAIAIEKKNERLAKRLEDAGAKADGVPVGAPPHKEDVVKADGSKQFGSVRLRESKSMTPKDKIKLRNVMGTLQRRVSSNGTNYKFLDSDDVDIQ